MPVFFNKSVVYLFLTVILLENSSAQEAATECNVRALLDGQRTIIGTESPRVRLADGTSFLNPFYANQYSDADLDISPTGAPAVGPMPRTSSEAARLFEQLKTMMISEISGQGSNLSPTQQLMIRRIRNLKFSVQQNCTSAAWNSQPTQVVNICDRLLRHPTYSLVAILSHEIGHSLDFCGLGSSNYERVEPLRQLSTHFRTPAPSPATQSYRQQLDSFPGAIGLIVQPGDPSIQQQVDQLVVQGALRLVDSGIELNKHPGRNTYHCLTRGFPNRRPYPQAPTQACDGSVYTEASAQIWAARTTARYMESHAPANPTEALGLFAGVELNSILAKGGGNKENDFNQIFLSEPAIQRAFNCRPSTQQNCMQQFQPSANRAAQALPAPQTAQ